MNDTRDLDTQIAVHLFGWRWLGDAQLWRDPDGLVYDVAAFRRRLPAYSRVPDATALVWQWLETVGQMQDISFHYDQPPGVACQVSYPRPGTAASHFVCTTGADVTMRRRPALDPIQG